MTSDTSTRTEGSTSRTGTFNVLSPGHPQPIAGTDTDDLFVECGTASSVVARQAIEAKIVDRYLAYADGVAARYLGRGIELEDLTQVARLGLCQAVRRFQPDKSVPFLAFAAPTIHGEIKRYFRDHGWVVRPPRRLQELHARIGPATRDLEQCLHRLPTTAELADKLGSTVAEVDEARCAETGYRAESLHRVPGQDGLSWEEQLATGDDEFRAADTRIDLLAAVATLTTREQRVVALRFGQDLTQSQTAAELGISQMQVCRIQAKILTTLQHAEDAEDAEDADTVARLDLASRA